MVKLLRLCVDYGEEHILAIKKRIPDQIVPTVDMASLTTTVSEAIMIDNIPLIPMQ